MDRIKKSDVQEGSERESYICRNQRGVGHCAPFLSQIIQYILSIIHNPPSQLSAEAGRSFDCCFSAHFKGGKGEDAALSSPQKYSCSACRTVKGPLAVCLVSLTLQPYKRRNYLQH